MMFMFENLLKLEFA